MTPALILAAVPEELNLLFSALEERIDHSAPLHHSTGFLQGIPLVVCAGGAGKVNAAIAATSMIERFNPKLLINTGSAGAYQGSGLETGDIAVADEEIFGDEGVITSSGWLDLEAMGLVLLKRHDSAICNRIPIDLRHMQEIMALGEKLDARIAFGSFVTVSTCSGTSARGEEISSRFGAVAESMEGAAAALAALRYGIEFVEIRGISNLVEERNMERWDMKKAVEMAQMSILELLPAINRVG